MLFCIKVSVRLRKNERKLFSTFLKGYVHGCKISMKKNMVEILPFNTTNIIDVNPGLAGQQHPCY